jgi:hypothetical protein
MSKDKNIIEKKLSQEIQGLTNEMHKRNSFWREFASGIVRGIGYAIGATIIFGIIVTILTYVVRTSDMQWVKQLADWAQLSEQIN